MDQPTISENEFKLAKAAYNWLRVSPLLTLPTLFIAASMGIGWTVCGSALFECGYNGVDSVNILIGVIASGLWHLLLLQYVNNGESEYIRKHGRRALAQAGIRTGVAAAAVLLDLFLGSGGCFIAAAGILLVFLWLYGFSLKQNIENEEKASLPAIPDRIFTTQPVQSERIMQTNPDELKQILEGLQSEDDVAVFSAIGKLDAIADIPDPLLKQAILKELEHMAREDENKDIQLDARLALDRLRQTVESTSIPSREPGETFKGEPAVILAQTLEALESGGAEGIRKAFDTLAGINYSSAAVRRQIEVIAVRHADASIRAEALALLNAPANRAVQKQGAPGKLDRGIRYTLLQEINDWEKSNLLDKQNADAIRRRYDFDFAPQTPPAPVPTPAAVPAPKADQAKPLPAQTPAPVPPEPRPSLLQTLTSEGAIKIYLYLGAFFVIAAAAILGAVVPTLRLPILIVGTFIFGGISVAIKKRLPQPSFALFIVFSFLLPITANSLEETLRSSYNLSSTFTSGYWAAIFLFMSAIWSGGTWLYESRFFSVAAFAAFLLAFLNLGNLFDPAPALNMTAGIAVLGGAAGTWLLKKWRDDKFAMPLFLSAQFAQAINVAVSFVFFFSNLYNGQYEPIWNLAFFAAWGAASVFYILSNRLFPFFAFPWLAAGALIPMPWFVMGAFETNSLPSALILFAWSALLAASSEVLRRVESQARYYLPALLASLPGFAFAVIPGFAHDTWLGFAVTLAIAMLFTALHIFHSRWWLWTLALLNAIIAYFAFFNFEFIEKLDIHGSYIVTLLTFLLLLPDLLLPKDWKLNLTWRLPVRIYAGFFTVFLSLGLLVPGESLHSGICYFILAALLAIYTLAYRKAWIGYLPAAYLALAAVFLLDAYDVDAWLPVLSTLAVVYFATGFLIRGKNDWASMFRFSGLTLGAIVSFTALILTKETGGWYMLALGALFLAEMHIRKNGWFEIGAPILFTSAAFLILRDFDVREVHYHLLAYSLIWVFADLLDHLTFRHPRPLNIHLRGAGAMLAVGNFFVSTFNIPSGDAAIVFGIYTLASALITGVYRSAWLGYIPAATLPLTILFTLDHFDIDAWLPALTGLAVLYFLIGIAVRAKNGWSYMLRNSALILGSLVSFAALIALKETGGWYALIAGLLFIAEMHIRKNGWFELGAPVLFTLGAYLILRDFKVETLTTHLLIYSLLWILEDLLAHLTFANPRPLKLPVRIVGNALALSNYLTLFVDGDSQTAAFGFGIYTLLYLTVSLVHRRPALLYAFTVTLPLFAAFLFRAFDMTQWIHPVIGVAVLYYAAGYFLRKTEKAKGWESPLLNSGLGLSVIVSIAAPFLGGLDASIPVAVAATLWAVEAHAKRNAWLAFPANGLYLLSYFIILFELDVNEAQYFSIGAALFGLIQHYLLTRAEGKTGAFVMGMFSQFILLGTTYIELVGKSDLNYFFLLFAQSLVVLVYGIVVRSRSLTFFPIGFAALGVVTVVYSALKDIGTIFVIGCTGIVLLILGVVAVLLRERIAQLGEKLSDWKA